MPRYFLHVRTSTGELIRDPEGDDLEDVEAARIGAREAAAELLAKYRGLDWRDCSFLVTDEHETVLFVLPFAEAIQPPKL